MMTEKIKILLVKQNKSTVDLAKELEVTPQNLYKKYKRDDFSEKELHKIAEVLNVTFEAHFVTKDGEKI